MVLRSRQKVWKRVAFSWVTLLILLITIILITRSSYGMYIKNTQANVRTENAQYELAKIQNRANKLKENLSRIKTTKGVEEELRRKFDVSRNNEHLLLIIDREIKTTPIKEERDEWDNMIHNFFK